MEELPGHSGQQSHPDTLALSAVTKYAACMRRRDLVRGLAESLPDQNNTVEYPDHPFLVRSPDVLSVVDGGLAAYFVHHSSDPRAGSREARARTLLSRLALPDGTTFILVTGSPDISLADDDVDLFDAVQIGIRPSNRPREQWNTVDRPTASIVRQLRPFHFARFAEAWAARNSTSAEHRRHGVPISRLRTATSVRPTNDFDIADGRLFGQIPESSTRATLNRRISRLVTDATELDYAPSLESLERSVGALLSDDVYLPMHETKAPLVASQASDIFKPYRAAAFAGIHTTMVRH